ncbi:BPSL0761 family protein [Pseudomonas amygdali]|uniref:BPSL0761 family protein n=1 Tax=Pseudomonas amygdali TaxID=47877 RepID=UPI0029500270|nr:BPSL0761 family protein [Pseudomonas amygdali]
MTTPNERTRAVIQTGMFLLELYRDSSLPERIRRDAKFLLRHYPDQFQVLLAGRIEEGADPLISPMGPVFSSSIENGYHSPCSGQLIPDTTLSFSSARAGASPPLN